MKPETFRDLLRISHGFEAAKLFLVANDLDLFKKLAVECTVDELANDLGLDKRALSLCLNALVALGLLVKNGDNYRNSEVSDRYLTADDYRGHIFRHIHHCWDSWNDLADVLQQGHPNAVRETAILHDVDEWNRDFIRGMDDVTRELAPHIVSQLNLGDAKRLLDVGGASGTYARAFLEKHPHLAEVTIFDLPSTLEVARESLSNYEHRTAVKLVAGNFHEDDLGQGYDLIWISQVFHSQNEEGCQLLIDKAWKALNPGGRLIIHEFLLDDAKTSPLPAALFAVHMLVMTQSGRAYSGGEIMAWLAARGYQEVATSKVSEDTGVVVGVKP